MTHVSSRHDVDTSKLLEQAREEFKGPLEVAYDGSRWRFRLGSSGRAIRPSVEDRPARADRPTSPRRPPSTAQQGLGGGI